MIKTYNDDEVLQECMKFYGGEMLPSFIVKQKYLMKDREGKYVEKSPDDMIRRLATEFEKIESRYKHPRNWIHIYNLLRGFRRVCLQGSPMSAVGNIYKLQSSSNCFVIDSPSDSINGIFHSALEIAQLEKRRGGVGIDLSTLRPYGSYINNAAAVSSGVTQFTEFMSFVSRMIGQNGRQGALMVSLDVRHPDAIRFIQLKNDITRATGCNIAIKITDNFMESLTNNKPFTQQFPIEGEPQIKKEINPKELWDIIIQSAWKTGEPGILMWDTITKNLPSHYYPNNKTMTTNPCGEVPLPAYESCRLVSMNLLGYVEYPFTKGASFNYNRYYLDVIEAQRLADDLVSIELNMIENIMRKIALSKEPDQDEMELWKKLLINGANYRRTGLGTLGLADAMICLGIKYDSDEALEFSQKLYHTHLTASYSSSITLAIERGPFPLWNLDYDLQCPFIRNLPDHVLSLIGKHGRRNVSNLTIAPTGTTSILACASSGIEPAFRWVYNRRVKLTGMEGKFPVDFVDNAGDKWTNFMVVHPLVKMYLEMSGIECPVKSNRDFSSPPDEMNSKVQKLLPEYFITSDKIDYKMGMKVQAMAQKYTDHSIAKTINLPRNTTVKEVNDIYLEAWRMGLKGVTVYVDGSRDGVLLSNLPEAKEKSEKVVSDDFESRPESIITSHAPKRPKSIPAEIFSTKVNGEAWHVVVGLMNGIPYEIWGGKGLLLPKPRKIDSAFIIKVKPQHYALRIHMADGSIEDVENLAEIYNSPDQRVITRSVCRELRHGIPVEFICKDLQNNTGSIVDYSSVLSRILKKYMSKPSYLVKTCPHCGGTTFNIISGCLSCASCNWSKCS